MIGVMYSGHSQAAIARPRYSLACISPPSLLRVIYNIDSDDEVGSPNLTGAERECHEEDNVIHL